ncbi:arsenic resistance protein [Ensifer sp. ENS01]|uniref:arsenic resistance protein n=1 Tax=Ensifer sp. ENS01 TaxID=2769293 RepID=UPI001781BA48|nr:arsenic resistance protein [Ensifer sp. ENS01]MBD9497923.1 arsenic resistance protein [Ensifer sp. ENS01]
MTGLRETLEEHQVCVYFCAVVLATVAALVIPGTTALEICINPALALMLLVTFLQVPLAELRQAFSRFRFLAILLATNFLVVPAIVAALVQVDTMLRLGVLLLLLASCIDYVVTFSHLGRADARLLLAATPALLIVQVLLLPGYLVLFLGSGAAALLQIGPLVHAFVWLIAVPLTAAVLVQLWAGRSVVGARTSVALGLLPFPATAVVLFVVVAAVVPQLDPALNDVLPIYVAFAVIAPLAGWAIARLFRLDVPAARSVAFSAATRNSLVVLLLAFAVPVLPAVIVTKTLVELVSELVYVRLAPKLGSSTVTSTT